MQIGIDGRYIQDHFPGIGRYTYNLIKGLAKVNRENTLFVLHNPQLVNTRHPLSALVQLSKMELVRAKTPTFSPAEQWHLPELARRLKLDLLHSPYYVKPYFLPCVSVVTIYDALSHRYPQYLPSTWHRLAFLITTRLAIVSARGIIATSWSTKEDLVKFFRVKEEKIAVTYLAAGEEFRPQSTKAIDEMRERYSLPKDYLLYLGINKPHKNLTRLIEAYSRLETDRALVLAGREDPRYRGARQAVEKLGLRGRVIFLGDISETLLPTLYAGAELFLFPSLYEGFGLPVLEAMACGTPVVCSNTSSLPEIVGEAAVTFDPLNVVEMAQAIAKALGDEELRKEMMERGLAQAQKFSWERTACETLALYREVIAS